MAKRFFAFGCSFTDYQWPTWADIIIREFYSNGLEAYNYGLSGTGNRAVLTNMMVADSIHHFTDEDILMVVWSSWTREDKFVRWNRLLPGPTGEAAGGTLHRWNQGGNILNNPIVDNQYIAKYWSLENDILSNISNIVSAKKLYNLAFEGTLSIQENGTNEKNRDLTNSTRVNDRVLSAYDKITMPHEFNNYGKDGKPIYFGHPNTLEHLKYIQEVIIPNSKSQITISQETINWASDIWHKLLSIIEKTDQSQHDGRLLNTLYDKCRWHEYLDYDSVIKVGRERPGISSLINRKLVGLAEEVHPGKMIWQCNIVEGIIEQYIDYWMERIIK